MDRIVGTGLIVWGGSAMLLAALALVLHRARRDGWQVERTVTVESDAPLEPEDLAALRILFDRHMTEAGDALYAAIVAQVAEDATEAEADAFLEDVLGGDQ